MRIPSRYALNTLISGLSLLLLVGCCQFFRGPDDVVSIAIGPVNVSIQPGSTQQFSATGIFGTGGTGDVTGHVRWTSSDPGRATIDSTGLATGIAYGIVTISGTYECSVARTSLSVVKQTVATSSIAIIPQNPKITVGLTQQFAATETYSDGTNSVITNSAQWTSSDNTIATVSATGLATGVSSGNVTITATSGTVSGSTTLTVQ